MSLNSRINFSIRSASAGYPFLFSTTHCLSALVSVSVLGVWSLFLVITIEPILDNGRPLRGSLPMTIDVVVPLPLMSIPITIKTISTIAGGTKLLKFPVFILLNLFSDS